MKCGSKMPGALFKLASQVVCDYLVSKKSIAQTYGGTLAMLVGVWLLFSQNNKKYSEIIFVHSYNHA